MKFYPHRTVEEQANRLPLELRPAYRKSQIDRITIFDGKNEIEVTGYAEYSYLNEKSYKTQPIRTMDGSIREIEQYETFLTPRLIIKYNMMNIDDYRAFMRMIKGRNGFIVKCYDIEEDEIVRNEMYVAPTSMPSIYQNYLAALGIKEYAIELIGTNVEINPENISDGTSIIGFAIDGAIYLDFQKVNLGQTWREFSERQPSFVEISEDDGFVFYKANKNKISVEPYATDPQYFVRADDYIFEKTYYAY
jgi:hypothetical protein